MYTSDIRKIIACYAAAAVFLFVFNMIYEKFSYGEYSVFMRNMYLLPVAGTVLVPIIVRFLKREPDRGFLLLFNSSLAVFVSGCIIKGIIEISGRSSDYDIYYIAGGLLFLLAAVARMIYIIGRK